MGNRIVVRHRSLAALADRAQGDWNDRPDRW
jgi:hypothetical protein